MKPLRHQLAYVRPALLRQHAHFAEDERVKAGLAHWIAHHLPLVVARQDTASSADSLRLGLPLPTQWDRLRLSLNVGISDILFLSEFPCVTALASRAGMDTRGALKQLAATLELHGLRARVYGSHGWQHISGLPYTHARSDMDLLIPVDTLDQADLAAQCLDAFDRSQHPLLRPDGELMFSDGTAVAWREWLPWRAGRTRQILIKQPEGIALTDGITWPIGT